MLQIRILVEGDAECWYYMHAMKIKRQKVYQVNQSALITHQKMNLKFFPIKFSEGMFTKIVRSWDKTQAEFSDRYETDWFTIKDVFVCSNKKYLLPTTGKISSVYKTPHK